MKIALRFAVGLFAHQLWLIQCLLMSLIVDIHLSIVEKSYISTCQGIHLSHNHCHVEVLPPETTTYVLHQEMTVSSHLGWFKTVGPVEGSCTPWQISLDYSLLDLSLLYDLIYTSLCDSSRWTHDGRQRLLGPLPEHSSAYWSLLPLFPCNSVSVWEHSYYCS